MSFSLNNFIKIKPGGADTPFFSHFCADFFVVSWEKPMAPHRPLKGPMVFLQYCEEGFSSPVVSGFSTCNVYILRGAPPQTPTAPKARTNAPRNDPRAGTQPVLYRRTTRSASFHHCTHTHTLQEPIHPMKYNALIPCTWIGS